MKCWKCGADYSEPFAGKLSFRASCDHCGAELHCCRNCVFYFPGKPNDCIVPGTDYVADRTTSNLCEEFKQLGKGPEKVAGPSEAAKRLFGDEIPSTPPHPKSRFDSLFGKDN